MSPLKADLESVDFIRVSAKSLTIEEALNVIEYKLKPHGNKIDYLLASVGDGLYDIYYRDSLTEEEWKLKAGN